MGDQRAISASTSGPSAAPRNQGVHLWSSDPANYPVLTTADRRRLAFGAQDKRNRTRADQDAAWEDLAGVEILTRTATTQDGSRGWLIVPAEAAAAIRSREGVTQFSGPVQGK